MKKLLVAGAMIVGAVVVPARAAAERGADGPTKLTDAQLDQVSAGDEGGGLMVAAAHASEHGRDHGEHGRDHGQRFAATGQGPMTLEQINFIIKNVRLTFNIQNSDVNLAAVLQFAFGGQPIQSGTAAAFQTGGH